MLANVLDSSGEAYVNWHEPQTALVYLQEAEQLLAPFAQQAPGVYGELYEHIAKAQAALQTTKK